MTRDTSEPIENSGAMSRTPLLESPSARRRPDGRRAISAPLADLDDEALTQLAADGDQAAMAEYFSRHLRFLTAMSRRIAMRIIDPDDLLSDAISSLLRRWRTEADPRSNLNAYLIRSMRNRVIDLLRSPASRTVDLAWVEEIPDIEDADLRSADLHREFALVRAAIAELPEDQQRVLIGVTVEGRKPAELALEMRRTPAGLYNLLLRAKKALRRELLLKVLTDTAPEECRLAIVDFPAVVPDDLDAPGLHGIAIDHIRGCERCRAAWARFLGLTSALGVGVLAIVAGQIASPSAASAAPLGQERPRGSARPLSRFRALSRPRRIALAGGAVASLVGIALAGVVMPSLLQTALSSRPVATLTAVSANDGSATTLNFDFGVDRDAWGIDEAVLSVRGGLVTATPRGWRCTVDAEETRCSHVTTGTGAFTIADTDSRSDYTLRIVATTATHVRITATSSGPLHDEH